WATLIALIDDGAPVLGVVSAPALNRRWWAATGSGAWTGRSLSAATRMQVSAVTELEDASLSYSSLAGWEDADLLDEFLSLEASVWRSRAHRGVWSSMLVPAGAVDTAWEPVLA